MDSKEFTKGSVATRSELRESKKLWLESRTDAEKYGLSVDALGTLHKKKAIDNEVYLRSLDRLQREYRETAVAAKDTASAIGGVGAGSRINKDLMGTGQMLAGQVPGVSAFTGALGSIGPIAAGAVIGIGAIRVGADLLVTTFGAVKDAVEESLVRIDETTDSAAKIGVTGDTLEALRLAALRSGIEAGTFDRGLSRLNKTLGEAASQGGKAAEGFSDIGLDIGKLASQSPERSFKEISEALGEIENPYERARIAQDLFGRSGRELIPVFLKGAEAIRKAEEDVRLFGTAVGQEGRDRVGEANDRLEDLGEIAKGAANTLAVELAPAIAEVGGELVQLNKDFGGIGGVVRDFVHFAAADIQFLVDTIKTAHPELMLLVKAAGMLMPEVDRELTQELDRQIKERQKSASEEEKEANKGRGVPGILPPEAVQSDKAIAEQERLAERMAADREALEGELSDRVRKAIENRLAEDQKALDKLAPPKPAAELGGPRMRPGLPPTPFWEEPEQTPEEIRAAARALAEEAGVDLSDPKHMERAQRELGRAPIDPREALRRNLESQEAAKAPAIDPREALQRNLENKEAAKEIDPLEALQKNLENVEKAKAEMAEDSGTPADKMLERLRGNIDPIQEELDKLTGAGASDEQLREAEKLLEKREADKTAEETAKEQARMEEAEVREGQRLIDQAERERDARRGFVERLQEKDDPNAKFDKDLAKLQEAREFGDVTPEEFDEIEKRMIADRDNAMRKKHSDGGAQVMKRGSAEAFKTIFDAMAGKGATKNPNAKVEDNTAKTAKAAEKVVDKLNELKEQMAKNLSAGF